MVKFVCMGTGTLVEEYYRVSSEAGTFVSQLERPPVDVLDGSVQRAADEEMLKKFPASLGWKVKVERREIVRSVISLEEEV